MPNNSGHVGQPVVCYRRLDPACTYMMRITYYPDTFERTFKPVPISEVPPEHRCRPAGQLSNNNFIDPTLNEFASSSANLGTTSISDVPGSDFISKLVHDFFTQPLNFSEEEAELTQPINVSKKDIEGSINDDYLISFLNGKRYKNLLAHLKAYNMNIHTYKTRFGLPDNYPSFPKNRSVSRRKAKRVKT